MYQDLPKSWEYTQIGDVCLTSSGGTPSRKNTEYYLGNIPWVKSGELNDGLIINIGENISEKAILQSSAKIFPKGTLLIAMYGATVGKLGILSKDAATNQAICAIFHPDDLEKKYIFWYLRFERSNLISSAVGGAQPNINQGVIKNLDIPLAPSDEQKRIVAEIEKQFSRLDEAVGNLKRVKANLKRYKASVLKSAVEGKLTKEWRKNNPDVEPADKLIERVLNERRKKWEEDSLAKMKAKGKVPKDDKWKKKYKETSKSKLADLYDIPKNWCWAKTEILSSFESNAICAGPFGTIFKAKDFRSEGIPIIFLRHVAPGKYLTHKPGFMDKKKWNELFQPHSVFGGELLITKLGDPPGACTIYPKNIGPAMVTPDVIKMTINPEAVDSKYLMHYLNS